jgi:diguanylate cyclase (GGDEF)-like protein
VSKQNPAFFPDRPDPGVLETLGFVRKICLMAVAAFSIVLICAWLIPTTRDLLPVGWGIMRINTALCAFFCASNLALFDSKFFFRVALTRLSLALFVILLGTGVLYEYSSGRVLGIDTVLAPDILSRYPGRMSDQTAICFVLLGVILLCLHSRRRIISYIVDGLTLCLAFLILVFASGYCFGALHLFGKSMENRISPQTLFCLFLLTVVVFSGRVKFGLFSVMLDSGIAGKTARLAIPFTLTLPFVAASLRGLAVENSLMQPEYATAFACSSSAMLFFCLVLLLSLRISALEQNIRDLSLRDELTGLYNRRGFYVLAAHALKVANRSGDPFSVLFLDVDNLKQINDSLGHEAGSELLQEFAVILGSTIRGTDVVGRVGGDEFVIAGNASVADIELVVKRIEDATYLVNARHDRSYLVSYSSGHVCSDPELSESLDDLLGQADKIMYQAKRDKRVSRVNYAGYSWNTSDAAAQ